MSMKDLGRSGRIQSAETQRRVGLGLTLDSVIGHERSGEALL